MKDFIENFASENGFIFEYGRTDFLNLYDGDHDSDAVFLFLDPLSSSKSYGQGGTVDSISWSGYFLLCKSSSLNEEDYNYRYENYIKPMIEETLLKFEKALRCSLDYTIESLSTTEVINSDALDFNFDGVSVNFTIREDK